MKAKVRGNGQGTAYLAQNKKSWVAQVVIDWRKSKDGKSLIPVKKKKSGFSSKKEALAACPGMLAEYRNPVKPKPKYTLKEVYDLWEPHYAPRIGSSTMVCYQSAYKHFKDIENTYIEIITPEDLQACIDKCPSGKRTKQNMKVTAGLLWSYASDQRIVDKDITRNLFIGKDETEQRPPLTDDEVEMFRNAIGKERYAEYIYCICYLGFRPGELLEIKKDQLFFSKVKDGNKVYNIWYFVCGKKTEAGKNRTVIIPDQVLDIILDRAFVPGTDYLFPQYVFDRKKPYKFVAFKEMTDEYLRDSAFKKMAKKFGINKKKVPYSARHTYADKLKKAAGLDKDKAALFGHTDYLFTQRKYQSTNMLDLKTVTDSLE